MGFDGFDPFPPAFPDPGQIPTPEPPPAYVPEPIPEPFIPEPFIPEPLIPEPFIPEPVIPEPFIPEPFIPEPFIPEPVIPEPLIPEPLEPTPDPILPEPLFPDPSLVPLIPEPLEPIPDPILPEPLFPEPSLDPLLPEPLEPIPDPILPKPLFPDPSPDPMIPEPLEPIPEPILPEPLFPDPSLDPLIPEPLEPIPDPIVPEPLFPDPGLDPLIPEPLEPIPDPILPEPLFPDQTPDPIGLEPQLPAADALAPEDAFGVRQPERVGDTEDPSELISVAQMPDGSLVVSPTRAANDDGDQANAAEPGGEVVRLNFKLDEESAQLTATSSGMNDAAGGVGSSQPEGQDGPVSQSAAKDRDSAGGPGAPLVDAASPAPERSGDASKNSPPEHSPQQELQQSLGQDMGAGTAEWPIFGGVFDYDHSFLSGAEGEQVLTLTGTAADGTPILLQTFEKEGWKQDHITVLLDGSAGGGAPDEVRWQDWPLVQTGGGFVVGAGLGLVPVVGPFLGDAAERSGVVDKPSDDFKHGSGLGQAAVGMVQILGGASDIVAGGAEVGGGILGAPETAGVSLGVSVVGVVSVAAGAAVAAQGVANVTEGVGALYKSATGSSGGPYLSEGGTRVSPRTTENFSNLDDIVSQHTWRAGFPAPYGFKGSTRPDGWIPGANVVIEAKNYDLSQGSGRLISNVVDQAIGRQGELPEGMKQALLIDLRGQNVTVAEAEHIITEINARTGNLFDNRWWFYTH